jgi:hypothetical protein
MRIFRHRAVFLTHGADVVARAPGVLVVHMETVVDISWSDINNIGRLGALRHARLVLKGGEGEASGFPASLSHAPAIRDLN